MRAFDIKQGMFTIMPITYKLLLLALIAALAAPFILKKPDGTPLMTLQQFFPEASSGINKIKSITKKDTQLYRYKDSKGHWQYTDTPPEQGQAEKVKLKSTITSMKTIELPEGFGEPKKEESFDANEDSGPRLPVTTAPLEKVPEMLQNIEGIQEKFDQRQSAIDAVTR